MREPNIEDSPKRVSTAKHRQFGWDCRHTTSVKHNVVKRWVKSWVGRSWDEMWAAAHLKFNRESLDYIDYLVDKNFIGYAEDGFPLNAEGYIHSNFYLDRNNLIRQAKSPYFKRRKQASSIEYVTISGQLYGLRTDAMWYRIFLKPVPQEHYQWVERPYGFAKHKTFWCPKNMTAPVYDMWFMMEIDRPNSAKFDDGQYCYKYQQVRTQELRAIKRALAALKVK